MCSVSVQGHEVCLFDMEYRRGFSSFVSGLYCCSSSCCLYVLIPEVCICNLGSGRDFSIFWLVSGEVLQWVPSQCSLMKYDPLIFIMEEISLPFIYALLLYVFVCNFILSHLLFDFLCFIVICVSSELN